MPVTKKKKPKGLPKRAGQRAAKYARYYAERHIGNKLRRILARNGERAARAWADAHMVSHVLLKMLRAA